jgi:hypothetical protein
MSGRILPIPYPPRGQTQLVFSEKPSISVHTGHKTLRQLKYYGTSGRLHERMGRDLEFTQCCSNRKWFPKSLSRN